MFCSKVVKLLFTWKMFDPCKSCCCQKPYTLTWATCSFNIVKQCWVACQWPLIFIWKFRGPICTHTPTHPFTVRCCQGIFKCKDFAEVSGFAHTQVKVHQCLGSKASLPSATLQKVVHFLYIYIHINIY